MSKMEVRSQLVISGARCTVIKSLLSFGAAKAHGGKFSKLSIIKLQHLFFGNPNVLSSECQNNPLKLLKTLS